MKIYLAAPFFTPTQLAVVQALENALAHHSVYSPRKSGVVLKDLPPAQRKQQARAVYEVNLERINWADALVAVIDGRDTGTVFEMGYAVANGKRIVSYTNEDYGLNVMLQECVVAHVRNSPHVVAHLFDEQLNDAICASYREFNPAVT